jgi:phosphoglycerate dehydrogenase-like enzyme
VPGSSPVFRVGVTRDVVRPDGTTVYDLSALDTPGVRLEQMPEHQRELAPAHLAGFDAVLLFSPRVNAATLSGDDRPLVLARIGVGYDNVDVAACTERGVLLTITPDAIRRPMAQGGMAFVLALAHRLPELDRHVREGGWDRFRHIGMGLQGRTLGLVGLGNVARDLVGLALPFGLRILACDPYAAEAPEGVELAPLEQVLGEADFVVIACPLNDETRHLIDADRLALMRPEAYLINIARGGIVDQPALVAALAEKRIAGAALDVFEQEPIAPDDPLLSFENVIVAPHGIGLLDHTFRVGGQSACQSVLAVAAGRVPRYVVNPAALDHPRLQGLSSS